MDVLLDHWKDPLVQNLATVLIALIVMSLIIRLLQRFLLVRIKEADTRYRMRKFVSFVGYAVVVLVALSVFSAGLRGFAVALGVAGAGIAFALQEVIASVAGWMAISVSHFYRTGDRVMVGGIKGDVIDIGILRTTVMEMGQWVEGDQYNGRIVRVANSFVFKEPVFNYSADFPFLWDEIKVPITYGNNERLARDLLQAAADEVVGEYARFAGEKWKTMVEKYFIEDASVVPSVMMTATENWMEFTIRYVVDYKKRRSTRDRLYARILEMVEASGGRVSIAGSTLQLTGVPPLEVHVATDPMPGSEDR